MSFPRNVCTSMSASPKDVTLSFLHQSPELKHFNLQFASETIHVLFLPECHAHSWLLHPRPEYPALELKALIAAQLSVVLQGKI